MKREIKFRGLNKCGIWCYGHYYIEAVSEKDNVVNWQPIILSFDDLGDEDVNMINGDTLGQFTGLLDKEGYEIYEGDILEYETGKPMTIGWSKKFASFILSREGWAFSHWFGESCNPENCKILGNIYKNKDLLI